MQKKDQGVSTKPFELEDWWGECHGDYDWGDLQAVVSEVVDPASAKETLHWGRNYLYVTELALPSATISVVVKQFRNAGFKKGLERKVRGSKGERSWRRAWQFFEAKVPTATPLLWIESKKPQGPSLFVTSHLGDMIEARYLLRARNGRSEEKHFPDFDFERFFESLGQALWHMHEQGLFHRDLSIGNVLVPQDVNAPDPEDLYIIDLNRSRQHGRLGPMARTRDLCRLKIDHPADQRLFVESYWQGRPPAGSWLLYRLARRAFLSKIEGKKKVRAPFKGLAQLLPRKAHAHIEDAPKGASARDKIVWDRLSDQPHQHAGRFQKSMIRLLDAPSHVRHLSVAALATPRILRRYRRLQRTFLDQSVAWPGAGVCVRPHPDDPDELLRAIDELGVRQVLLRLHPWQEEHGLEEELARELAGRGLELAYSLPQNRDLVRDRDLWRRRIEDLAERFLPYGQIFQVGQAMNRSKWGVWRYGEYLRLARSAAEVLRSAGDVTLLGPAVIDFEPYATASLINQSGCPRFDGLASLLYVDRRGAPENEQMQGSGLGFDGQGKALLCRAMAETSRRTGPESWITEVNWPLWEGPHSPAGKKVSVDEQSQADYLARFYLLTLATGAAARIYWWQLVARGYGLAVAESDGSIRRRPAFEALRTLEEQLRGHRLESMLEAPAEARLMRFESEQRGTLVVGWSTGKEVLVELPGAVQELIEQDGKVESGGGERRFRLAPSVRYFRI